MGSMKTPKEASNADEYLLQHTLHFAESLKDLRSTRAQMYSAAEHFEMSYKNNQHQELVEEAIKEYITKALISTVDHLGSVAYKVDSLLDEKVNEFSSARLQFSGIEQRLKAHQQFINLDGISRQSLVPDTTKHYKRYSNPGFKGQEEMVKIIPSDGTLCPRDDFKMERLNNDDSIAKAFQLPVSKRNVRLQRKGHTKPHSTEDSPKSPSFSFTRAVSIKEIGKRAVSPLKFPVLHRSGSVANRSISPSSANTKQRYPSEPKRPNKVLMKMETSKERDIEVYTRKSKHLLKALLSIHKSRKQGTGNDSNVQRCI